MTRSNSTEFPPPIQSLSLGELVDLFVCHASGEASEGFLRQILPFRSLDIDVVIRMLLQESNARADQIATRYRSESSLAPESATKDQPNGLTSPDGGFGSRLAVGSGKSASEAESSDSNQTSPITGQSIDVSLIRENAQLKEELTSVRLQLDWLTGLTARFRARIVSLERHRLTVLAAVQGDEISNEDLREKSNALVEEITQSFLGETP